MDPKGYIERLDAALTGKDRTAVLDLIDKFTKETKEAVDKQRDLRMRMFKDQREIEIDARLVQIGLGDLVESIAVLGPTAFEIIPKDGWTLTLGELIVLGRAFDTAAIFMDIEDPEDVPCPCGDSDCEAVGEKTPGTRLVITVAGARI